MAPPSDEDQTNLGYRLRIIPSAPVTIYRDGFGNRVDLFNILTPYQELVIRATSIVRTHRARSGPIAAGGVAFEPEHERFRTAVERSSTSSPARWSRRCPELDEFLARTAPLRRAR